MCSTDKEAIPLEGDIGNSIANSVLRSTALQCFYSSIEQTTNMLSRFILGLVRTMLCIVLLSYSSSLGNLVKIE